MDQICEREKLVRINTISKLQSSFRMKVQSNKNEHFSSDVILEWGEATALWKSTLS